MKNRLKSLGIIFILCVVALAFIACANKNADTSAETTNSSELLELLNEYDTFIDSYVALAQRMLAGDLEAASELENYDEKFEEWSEKFDRFSEDDFTPEIVEKLETIGEKIGNLF